MANKEISRLDIGELVTYRLKSRRLETAKVRAWTVSISSCRTHDYNHHCNCKLVQCNRKETGNTCTYCKFSRDE
jgi:hypothetical protein